MLQATFLMPISKGGSLTPHNLKCMTPDVLNNAILQGGSQSIPTPKHCSKCCKQPFSCPLGKGKSYPTQSKVNDSKCCKWLFSCWFASGESYPPKLPCMTLNVRKDVSHAHSQGAVLPTQTPGHDSKVANDFYDAYWQGGSYPPNFQCMTQIVANDISRTH